MSEYTELHIEPSIDSSIEPSIESSIDSSIEPSIEPSIESSIESSISSYIPIFTNYERDHYIKQKDKAHFTSPEEEYSWSETQHKTCSKCKEEKLLIQFNGNTSGTDAFDKLGYRLRRPECGDCTKKANKGKDYAKQLAKKNGISYKAPEGATCAICLKLPVKGNGLVFDHCHKQQTFRGYCCNSCNRSMGVLGDNIEGILNVINYLLKTDPTKIIQAEDGTLSILHE